MVKLNYNQSGNRSMLFLARGVFKGENQLEIVETRRQYKELLKLRKKIFVEKEGYPWKEISNGYEKESVHILAKRHGAYVGMMSIKLDDELGLPLDGYVKPFRRVKRKIAEFDKFGVLDERKHKSAFYELISAAYVLTRVCGYNTIVIFTLKKKTDNIRLYKKIGFCFVEEFILFDDKPAVMMIIELDKAKGLMWRTDQLIKAAKRVLSCVNGNSLLHR